MNKAWAEFEIYNTIMRNENEELKERLNKAIEHMNNLTNKSIQELADRLNQIMVERDRLYIEYAEILEELYKRLPNLKDDENLKLKKIKNF